MIDNNEQIESFVNNFINLTTDSKEKTISNYFTLTMTLACLQCMAELSNKVDGSDPKKILREMLNEWEDEFLNIIHKNLTQRLGTLDQDESTVIDDGLHLTPNQIIEDEEQRWKTAVSNFSEKIRQALIK